MNIKEIPKVAKFGKSSTKLWNNLCQDCRTKIVIKIKTMRKTKDRNNILNDIINKCPECKQKPSEYLGEWTE